MRSLTPETGRAVFRDSCQAPIPLLHAYLLSPFSIQVVAKSMTSAALSKPVVIDPNV